MKENRVLYNTYNTVVNEFTLDLRNCDVSKTTNLMPTNIKCKMKQHDKSFSVPLSLSLSPSLCVYMLLEKCVTVTFTALPLLVLTIAVGRVS